MKRLESMAGGRAALARLLVILLAIGPAWAGDGPIAPDRTIEGDALALFDRVCLRTGLAGTAVRAIANARHWRALPTGATAFGKSAAGPSVQIWAATLESHNYIVAFSESDGAGQPFRTCAVLARDADPVRLARRLREAYGLPGMEEATTGARHYRRAVLDHAVAGRVVLSLVDPLPDGDRGAALSAAGH